MHESKELKEETMNGKTQFLVNRPKNNEEVLEAVRCWSKVGTGGTFSLKIRVEDYQSIFIATDSKNQLLGAVEFLRDKALWIGGYLLRSHEIYNIAVYPQHQRQGIGKALVLAVEELSKWEGKAGLFSAYSKADEFWKSLGYQKTPPAFWHKVF